MKFLRWLPLIFLGLVPLTGPAWGAPVVTNVGAVQRPGTRLVDITYDLATPGFAFAEVSLEISSDGGVTFDVPAVTVSGAVGAGVTPGTGKTMVWDAGADWNKNQSNAMRFRVTARDDHPDGLRLVPAGSFTMGASGGDGDSDAPAITVTVSPFFLQETETTLAQWQEVRTWAVLNGYNDLATGAGEGPDHPVHSVSWFDVVKWCNARSEREGLTPCYSVAGAVMRTGTTTPEVNWSANGYRLPTEAEWEKAARGGVSGKRFASGDDTITHTSGNYQSSVAYAYDVSPTRGFHPDHNDGSAPYTSPVGSFAANPYGFVDLAGNVVEFCWDLYDGDFYTFNSDRTDPKGPAAGSDRVVRGGGWNSFAEACRNSHRARIDPSVASPEQGFRVARGRLIDHFATVPGGTFSMGVTNGDTDVNAPSINVTVNTVYVEETETTKALWDEVRTWAVANGYGDLAAGAGKGPIHPVQSVSWWDAVKWCNARSEYEGLTPVYTIGGAVMRTGTTVPVVNWTANGYRLPTEAEWEKAARAGFTGFRFPRGTNIITHLGANYVSSSEFAYDTSSTRGFHPSHQAGGTPFTSPVGSFPANGHGLRDLSGNVAEWCWDWFDSGAYLVSQGTTDPRGPATGSARVLRGGSWDGNAYFVRSAARNFGVPESLHQQNVGFRSVRTTFPRTTPLDSMPPAPGAESGDVVIDARSDNAALSSLFLSSGTLDPSFQPDTTTYTTTVSHLTAEMLLVPTKAEGDATIAVRVNGGSFVAAASGAIFGPFPITVGVNPIEVRVTAENGFTTRSYTVAVTREKAPQTIVFAPIPDQLATATVTLAASGGASGNPVTFRVTNGPATIAGDQLSFTGAGVVTVFASQLGNATYADAVEVARTFTVAKAPAAVSLSGLAQTYDGVARMASATTNPAGKNVLFTYDGSPVAPTNAGIYAVVATIDDSHYQGSASGTLVVARAGQSLTFATIPDQFIGASLALGAVGGGSGSPVVYEVVSGPAEIVNGNELRFTGEGNVMVRATQAGDGNHEEAAGVEHTFAVVLPRPDVAVGASLAALSGVGIYTSPTGQIVRLTSKKARPVTGVATVMNRASLPGGAAADELRLTGTPGNRLFTITYLGQAGNLTAALVAGTYRTDAIDGSDEAVAIRVAVKPKKKKIKKLVGTRTKFRRKAVANLVQAVSTTHAAAKDGGMIHVQTR